jgi:hypothetical protein
MQWEHPFSQSSWWTLIVWHLRKRLGTRRAAPNWTQKRPRPKTMCWLAGVLEFSSLAVGSNTHHAHQHTTSVLPRQKILYSELYIRIHRDQTFPFAAFSPLPSFFSVSSIDPALGSTLVSILETRTLCKRPIGVTDACLVLTSCSGAECTN